MKTARNLIAMLLIVCCLFSGSSSAMMVGGWSAPDSYAVPAEAEAALAKAIEPLPDLRLEPVALLATQVVAGVNYCILCRSLSDDGIAPVYTMVYVYADLNGGAELTCMMELDVAFLADPGMIDVQDPFSGIPGFYFEISGRRIRLELTYNPDTDTFTGTILGSSGATEATRWTFSGRYSFVTNTITYTDCTKTTEIYDETGCTAATVHYENGTGTLTVLENGDILWLDDMENAGENAVFTPTVG